MPNIIPFTYEGRNVRVVMQNNEPWWVASDVCKVLAHSDVSMAVSRLDDDEKGTSIVCTPGGNQQMLCVNEPGLYSLILTSRKPEAKTFKRWVTHEVLPAIRKTGTYSTQPQSTANGIGEIVSDPKRLTKYIYHLQGLQDVLYPEHIMEEQPLAPEDQLKQDVLRILTSTGKPLTPSMLRYSYFKRTPKEALYRACEELAVSGQLTKEITSHAPEGRFSVA